MDDFKIGVLVDSFKLGVGAGLQKAHEAGAQGIQIYAVDGEMDPARLSKTEVKEKLKQIQNLGLEVTALCGDLGGYGFARAEDNPWKIEKSKKIIHLGLELGCRVVTTHIGGIPADRSGRRYAVMQDACRMLGEYAYDCGATFAIETGQEKAASLARFIEDAGVKGIGVNFDPANLVMVANDDPVRAVNTLGQYIVHTHATDGVMLKSADLASIYDASPKAEVSTVRFEDYFKEVRLGQGGVNFDAYLAALRGIGYQGYLTVEREKTENPEEDIRFAVDFLKTKLRRTNGFFSRKDRNYGGDSQGLCFEFNNSFFESPRRYGPVKLFQIGELCCERGFEAEPHCQACDELSFVVSGEGTFSIDGRRLPVREGDIIINQRGETHAVESSKQSNLRFLYLGFDTDKNFENKEMQTVFDFFSNPIRDRIKRDRFDIRSLFHKLLAEFYHTPACSEEMIMCYLIQIIVTTYRTFQSLPEVKPIAYDNENVIGSTVYGVVKYIESNLMEIEGVKDIADKLGYSSVYLSHLFHQKMGKTLQSYINCKKMERSLQMMENGCYNITQIALMLNFGTLQSFSKAFKRTFGVSPSTYQESLENKSSC